MTSAPIPDQLLFDDEALPLLGEPLSPWLAHEGLQAVGGQGHVATWRLHGERLCLIAIAPALDGAHWRRDRDERRVEMSLVALHGSERPLWAEWFSGRLRCPGLPCLRYSEYGIPQAAQHDLVIDVAAGRARRIGFEAAPVHELSHPAEATPDEDGLAPPAARRPWSLPAWRPALRRWHLLPHRPAH